MSEPVAYLAKSRTTETVLLTTRKYASDSFENTPLYTSEQLHPRVKMTQAEFYEWKELYYRVVELSLTACKMLNEISDNAHNSIGKYTKLAKRVYQDNEFMSVSKKQTELVNLFINYSPDTPEETIEIVPDMKWFVRSKEPDDEGYYAFLENLVQLKLNWCYSKYKQKPLKIAVKFETKEQAEEWCNPLTEAVLLPVEGE
ncbi:hypothetical protein J6K93_07355 [Leuconostoc mesenteroides]|uniref:hypothetical protein n=1 Tax=Leuconostoc mesenteroides TaxID=1245 RepID=UPI001CBC65F0|nr:hypothetical protein [Leuconostoc mesenteroides]MBZ1510975.1 hypothetical protein [Leuconostoc mesenteroides]